MPELFLGAATAEVDRRRRCLFGDTVVVVAAAAARERLRPLLSVALLVEDKALSLAPRAAARLREERRA